MSPEELGYFTSGGLEFSFLNAYQPIVDIRSNEIFAYECLARGPNNEPPPFLFKHLNPDTVSPLDQAIREVAISRAVALNIDAPLSLNFGTACLISENAYLERTFEHAEKLGFQTTDLIIELTESDVIHGVPGLTKIIDKIHRYGANIALDDFGAGYAGLNSLIDVNPDVIKLDMYLIRGIDKSGPRQATVRALARLAEDLGIDLVAEGVETQSELQFLQATGIELIQGYLLAKPGLCCLPVPQRPN